MASDADDRWMLRAADRALLGNKIGATRLGFAVLLELDLGNDPGQVLTHRPPGKALTSEHPRVEYLNKFPCGPTL